MLLKFLSEVAQNTDVLTKGGFQALPTYAGLTRDQADAIEKGNLQQVLQHLDQEVRTLFGEGTIVRYGGVEIKITEFQPTSVAVNSKVGMTLVVSVVLSGENFPKFAEQYFTLVLSTAGATATIEHIRTRYNEHDGTAKIQFDATFPQAGFYSLAINPTDPPRFAPIKMENAVHAKG